MCHPITTGADGIVTTFAQQAAEAFYDRIISGDYDVIGDHFTDDAVFLAPNGETYTGREEIGRFYSSHLRRFRPNPRIAIPLATDRQALVEIRNASRETGEYHLNAVNHFTFTDDGKVQQLHIFVRGSQTAVDATIGRYGGSGSEAAAT